jgi:aldehyde dehydrogenase (NAD+)
MKLLKLYINGEWNDCVSGEVFESINPETLQVVAKVPRGKKEDIDAAVKAARQAFESAEWRDMLPANRSRILLRFAQIIREHKNELAELEVLDTGRPLMIAQSGVNLAARYFEFYGGAADKILGETIPVRHDFLDFTIREPLGVTAHIVPWNYPTQMAARSVAPALAAGNTVVIKPAEDTPMTTLKLAELAELAGIPKGVFNVVTGFGYEAGAALASHPDINHITFTGSVETGSNVMRSASDNIVTLTLELGGKSPQIVFADADLEDAARNVVRSITRNAGQTCAAGSRLLVEKSIHKQFVQLVQSMMDKLTYGTSYDNPDLSPVISEKQISRIEHYIELAVKEGSHIVRGGKRKEEGSLIFEPTIIDYLPKTSPLLVEEIFGPVLVVQPFESLEEALEIANNTPYGLAAYIHTKDVHKAHWLARKIRAGQIFINSTGVPEGGAELPFGGVGKSGYGREKGLEALKHYTQLKNITLKINP